MRKDQPRNVHVSTFTWIFFSNQGSSVIIHVTLQWFLCCYQALNVTYMLAAFWKVILHSEKLLDLRESSYPRLADLNSDLKF
jgi:hypothetical protein